MNKSRSVMVKKNPSPDPINDVCPHQHFKSDIIDRSILSRKQHLNLLCTPKGYRWMIKKANSSRTKSPDGCTNSPCRLTKKKPGKTYVHNILAEMWDFITPEMVNRMKEMLMTEFGLSEEAAIDFICQSRYDTNLTANPPRRDKNRGGEEDRPPEGATIPCLNAAQKLCKNDLNIGINPMHIKEFSKAVSSKFSNYVAAMMCAKRNSKHRTMAEVILKGLCDLTGEETTLDSPKNRLHKILANTSDRVALWLVGNMGDEDEERGKRRRKEDRILKRKTLARQYDKKRRQKEKDRMNKENEKNGKRKAQEENEKSKSANEERERKRAEREKRHMEMDKFRKEDRQKQKEEIKKAKEESLAAKTKGASAVSGGSQARDRSKVMGQKAGRNYEPSRNDQLRKGGMKSKTGGQVASGTRKTTSSVGNKGEGGKLSSTGNQSAKDTGSHSDVPTSESTAGVSQIGDTESKSRLNQKDPLGEISTASQLTTSRSVNWGDNKIKNVASAFSASGKVTPTSSTSSAVDKLAELLSSRGMRSSGTTSQEKSATALSSQDKLLTSHSSQGINAKFVNSQGKLVSEHSSHQKLGAASSMHGTHPSTDSHGQRKDMELELESSSYQGPETDRQRRKGSLLTVKKIGYNKYEVRKTRYAEAKQKVGAVRRDSPRTILPPNLPFDPNDPKSWALWVDYATQMAEDWGNWIDKTIQETEDKAMLYQTKAIEGKTQPEDEEDWNKFVEKTNEDAIRWRRQRKSIFDAAKEWQLH